MSCSATLAHTLARSHARTHAPTHPRTHAPTHTIVAAARPVPHPLLGNRGEDEEASVFATSNEWLRNKTKLNRVFTEEYGPEFPLVKPANLTDALYIAQGELQWLWVGQSAVLCTTGPCILLQVCALPRPNASALVRPRIERFALTAQFIGLFILTRERAYWTYIQYTMYVQFFMLAYMAFLVWLMCMAVRMVSRTGWLPKAPPRSMAGV